MVWSRKSKKRKKPADIAGASGNAVQSDADSQTGELEGKLQSAIAAQRWNDAYQLLQEWVEQDPDNLHLHRKLGDVYLKLNKKKEALQVYWDVVHRLSAEGQYRQAQALNQLILRLAPKLDQARKKAIEIEAKLGFYRHPLFSDLNDEEMGEVVRRTQFRRFPKESIVIREGEPGRSLFMICSGNVDVYVKNASRGIAEHLSRLGKDNFFGEGGFITGSPRSATVLTIEDTVFLELSRQDLEEVVRIHPKVGEYIEQFHQARQSELSEKGGS
jgi:tetratricopeptide (TPR) repeat protein